MQTTSKLIATCELREHPEGRWEIKGIKHRPEWGRMPMFGEKSYKTFDKLFRDAVKTAVENANKYGGRIGLPHVGIEIYDDGRTRIIVQEKSD